MLWRGKGQGWDWGESMQVPAVLWHHSWGSQHAASSNPAQGLGPAHSGPGKGQGSGPAKGGGPGKGQGPNTWFEALEGKRDENGKRWRMCYELCGKCGLQWCGQNFFMWHTHHRCPTCRGQVL